MHDSASKRRSMGLLSLLFVSKLFSGKLLIKCLKRDNQLQLFRWLERSSEKLINAKCALEFIQLCQSFDLTPTFAKVESSKAEKWKQSAKKYEQDVIAEELSEKKRLISNQKNEVSDIFAEIRKKCNTLRYISVSHTTVESNNKAYDRIMKVHTKKLSRMVSLELNVNEHIQNISSHHLFPKVSVMPWTAICSSLSYW